MELNDVFKKAPSSVQIGSREVYITYSYWWPGRICNNLIPFHALQRASKMESVYLVNAWAVFGNHVFDAFAYCRKGDSVNKEFGKALAADRLITLLSSAYPGLTICPVREEK